jgi:hypothetical protein
MKLNKLISAALLATAFTASTLLANTVHVSETNNDGDDEGGEYLAKITNGPTFYTFCLENFVKVALPGTYEYTVDTRAFSGGTDKHDPIGAGPAGDPLSKGTAYLYEQFTKGTLVDSDGSGNYLDNHDVNAGLLQKAFWTLEDEYNYGANNPYVKLVTDMFGLAGAYETVGADSRVKVMNLWKTSSREDVQSMLIYVPDSGMTAALLGLGLLSLAAFRRKL